MIFLTIIKSLIKNEAIYMLNKYEQGSFVPNNQSERVKVKQSILSKILSILKRNKTRKIQDKIDDRILYEKEK